MDQAKTLREMMGEKKGHRAKCPFALLVSSDSVGEEKYIKRFAAAFSGHQTEEVALIGIETKGKKEKHVIERQVTLSSLVSGKAKKEEVRLLVEEIKHLEENGRRIFYYAGKGVKTESVNLLAFSQDILFFMKPNKTGVNELVWLAKVLSKWGLKRRIFVVQETDKGNLYEKENEEIKQFCKEAYGVTIQFSGYWEASYSGLFSNEEVAKKVDFESLVRDENEVTMTEHLREWLLSF